MNLFLQKFSRCNKLPLSVKALFTAVVTLLLAVSMSKAQEPLEVISGESNNVRWRHFSDAPNSLYHHLSGHVFEFVEQRQEKISGIRSASDWRQRQEVLRQTLMEVVGPFPEKTPLNATITRTIQKDDYKVEHIVYESQPGFYVTSSLFIPSDLQNEPAPAVLFVSGHYGPAYRAAAYQQIIINLVQKGFIVFAIDPVGQGERLEYYDPNTRESMVGGPTSEHSYPGAQAFITGSSQARYMTWDGIRAVDYLVGRKEVDSERIGLHGMSGGGTQTAYIAAFDERIYASAPSNYVNNFKRLFQSIGPQDAEQNLFHGTAKGIDIGDLLAVRAPKPLLIASTSNDFFSLQGARETAEEVGGIYASLGKSDNISMTEDFNTHSVTKKNREAIYAFFQYHLNNPGNPEDLDVTHLSDDEIRVTESGQISQTYDGETVFSLNRKEAEGRISDLNKSRNNTSVHLSGIPETAKKISGYMEPESIDEPVITGRFQRDGYVLEKYFVYGEGDYIIPYLLMVPEKSNGKAVIYLHPESKAADASVGGEMEWFVKKGFTVLAPDLIGVGEMGTGAVNRREWRITIHIARSIVAIQAGDVIRLARLLEKKHNVKEVYGFAKKQMAPVMLHASAFDPIITRVALLEPYSSYQSIVMNRFYKEDFIPSTVAGSIGSYDLPDLAATLAPRKLLMAGVTDGQGQLADSDNIQEEYSIAKNAYQSKNASAFFTISSERAGNPDQLFDDWIN